MTFRIHDHDGHKRVALGDIGTNTGRVVESLTKAQAKRNKGWVNLTPMYRYVRWSFLTALTSSQFLNPQEIEVYNDQNVNVALGIDGATRVGPNQYYGYQPSEMTDGVTNTLTHSVFYPAGPANDNASSITLDLGEEHEISKTRMYMSPTDRRYTTKCEVSQDGVTWVEVGTPQDLPNQSPPNNYAEWVAV